MLYAGDISMVEESFRVGNIVVGCLLTQMAYVPIERRRQKRLRLI